MARKRMIDPSIWTDEGMAVLTVRQQLLFIGLFSNADDSGRLKCGPLNIRLMLPTAYGDPCEAEVRTDLDAVIGAMRHLCAYEVDGRSYLAFTNWTHWQKVEHPTPSSLPAPPDEAPFHLNGGFTEASPKPHRDIAPSLVEVSLVEVSLGEVSETRAKRAPRHRVPITEAEIEGLATEFGPHLGGEAEVRERITAALNHNAVDKVKGEYPYVRTWLRNDVQRAQKEPTNGSTRNSARGPVHGVAPGAGGAAPRARPGERQFTSESERQAYYAIGPRGAQQQLDRNAGVPAADASIGGGGSGSPGP